MKRISVLLLALALVVAPLGSDAQFNTMMMAGGKSVPGVPPTPPQTIASVNLSGTSFPPGAGSGTVIGTVTVTMSPTSPLFTGSGGGYSICEGASCTPSGTTTTDFSLTNCQTAGSGYQCDLDVK